jgi:hypothetical protein
MGIGEGVRRRRCGLSVVVRAWATCLPCSDSTRQIGDSGTTSSGASVSSSGYRCRVRRALDLLQTPLVLANHLNRSDYIRINALAPQLNSGAHAAGPPRSRTDPQSTGLAPPTRPPPARGPRTPAAATHPPGRPLRTLQRHTIPTYCCYRDAKRVWAQGLSALNTWTSDLQSSVSITVDPDRKPRQIRGRCADWVPGRTGQDGTRTHCSASYFVLLVCSVADIKAIRPRHPASDWNT